MAAVNWAARDAAMRNVPLTLMHVIAPVVPAVAPCRNVNLKWPRCDGADFSERRNGTSCTLVQ